MAISIIRTIAYNAWAWWDHRKTRGQVRPLAEEHGWSYLDSVSGLQRQWRGASRAQFSGVSVEHVVGGEFQGYEFVSFQLRWLESVVVVNEKKYTSRHVVCLRLPRELPTLSMEPESLMKKARTVINDRRITFESAEFNKQWRVLSADPRFASEVIHPRFMEWAMGAAVTGATYEFLGNELACTLDDKMRAEKIVPTLTVAAQLLEQVPAAVWETFGTVDGQTGTLTGR